MNQVSNLLKKVTPISISLVALLGSLPVAAMDSPNRTTTPATSTPTQTKESAFCTNLTANGDKVTSGIANMVAHWTAAKTQRTQELATNDAKWDQAIATNRAKWDQERQTNFTKLEANAKTPAEVAAVKAYETTVLAAVSTRRAAFDQARQTYRQAVMQVIMARQGTVDGQITTLTSAANNAISVAMASCMSSPSTGPAIRTQFQASLKAAREAYTAARKGDDTTTTQIQQLAQQRDASFKAADAAFDTAVKAAQATLRAAFKDTNA